jgi:hypothetical protein
MSDKSSSAYSDWSLHEWNARLVAGILLTPDANGLFEPLYSINFGPLSLSRYVGLDASASEAAFKTFEDTLRNHVIVGGYDFDSDGYRLRRAWKASSDSIPPFWAHLVYSCYVAATTESMDEDFRRRLMTLLRIEGYPPLADLPKLWKAAAAWSGHRFDNLKDCRKVVIAGDWRVRIGYSYNFAFPKRRDNFTLVHILKAEHFMGAEPPVTPVLRALEKHRFSFSGEFNSAFDDFRGLYNNSGRVDRFWAVIREAALFGKGRHSPSIRWSAILRIIRGQADVTIVAEDQNETKGWQTLEGNFSSIGLLTVTLGSPDELGARAAMATVLKGTGMPTQGKALARLFALGVVVFSFETIGTYKVCFGWPQDGPLALLCASHLATVISPLLGKPRKTTDLGGLLLFENVSISELRDVAKRFPNVFLNGPLAATAPPIHLSVRDGYWADSGRSVYLGIPELLPHLTVEGAETITALCPGGVEISLNQSSNEWRFPLIELSGEVAVTAYSATEPLAATRLHFQPHYSGVPQIRLPREPEAYWTSSSSGRSVSATPLFIECEQDEDQIPDLGVYAVKQTHPWRPFRPLCELQLSESPASLALREGLASTFSHRQSVAIPEIEALFERCLSNYAITLWAFLEEWEAAGCLHVLRQKRWRGTQIFGVTAHLRVYQVDGRFRAITSGLFTAEMFARLVSLGPEFSLQARVLDSKNFNSPIQIELEASTLSNLQAIADIFAIPVRSVVDETTFGSENPLNVEDGEISAPTQGSLATWTSDFSFLEPGMTLELHKSTFLPNRYVLLRRSGSRSAFLTRFAALSAAYQLTATALVHRLGDGIISTVSAGTRLPASANALGRIFGSQRITSKEGTSRDYVIDLGSDALAQLVLGPLMPHRLQGQPTSADRFINLVSQSGRTMILTEGVLLDALTSGGPRMTSPAAIPWLLHRKGTLLES